MRFKHAIMRFKHAIMDFKYVIMRFKYVIYNGNCTEWSAIWCEIKRVITKIARPRSGSAICKHKFDFTPKLHDMKCNFHFIIFILKSETLFVNLEEPDAFLFKNVHTFASSFTSRSLATVAK